MVFFLVELICIYVQILQTLKTYLITKNFLLFVNANVLLPIKEVALIAQTNVNILSNSSFNDLLQLAQLKCLLLQSSDLILLVLIQNLILQWFQLNYLANLERNFLVF